MSEDDFELLKEDLIFLIRDHTTQDTSFGQILYIASTMLMAALLNTMKQRDMPTEEVSKCLESVIEGAYEMNGVDKPDSTE